MRRRTIVLGSVVVAACVGGTVAATASASAAGAIGVGLAVMALLWAASHTRDAVAVASVLLVLLFVVPAPYSISGLKSVGAPSFVVAVAIGTWWLFERFLPNEERVRGLRPVHMLLAIYALSWFVSYTYSGAVVHAPVQARALDRSLLVIIGWAGIAVAIVDGISSRARLQVLIRRVVFAGTYAALVGILQSRKVYDLARFSFPGLELRGADESTYDVRSGFDRIASVTLHPIEFAALLGVVFPIALHLLVTAKTRRERRVMGVCTAIIGVAMPMSVTRTGVLGFGVALLVLVPAWPRPLRRKFYVYAVPSVIAMRLAFPGLLGTLRSLFTVGQEDPSVAGRTEDFPLIFDLIARHPITGIGPGTFSPQQYFYLDNQILGTAVELGGFGLFALFALFLGSAAVAAQGGRQSGTDDDRLLGRALAAALLAGFATFFTFDALSFPVLSTLMFLLVGIAGALYRLTAPTKAFAMNPSVSMAR